MMGTRSLKTIGFTIHSMIKFLTLKGVAIMQTSREALWECRKIEEMHRSWKEKQWRYHIEQMSRIWEQAILQNRNMVDQRLRKGPMVNGETGEHSMVGEKVVVCNKYPDQPVIINDNLSSGYVEETLNKLGRENVKVDSRKCAFGMEEGKFLGHIVTNEGIRVDPDKVKAIMRSPIPSDPSQIRSLSLRLANIGRFIPKLSELMHPIRNVQRSLDAAKGPN
ncbi:hypothetical protein Tco_0738807 [Tanacetum coccineum]